ncbi:MAG: Cof-type HAD-IIB family hydrolase [Erysipelotrichaceae bacterium]|nr:Cof-type HAD-IIB family hydrolase [Erysipelotrichaceae bacterium]
MIKAIFLDFDGTLFSHTNECVPDSTVEAVKECQKKGIKVYNCTGRSKTEMTWFDIKGIEYDGQILSNGQVILDRNGEVLYENPIKGELLEKMKEIYNAKKQTIYFVSNDDVFMNVYTDTVKRVQAAVSSEVPEIKEYHDESIYMASAFFDTDEEKDALMALKEYGEVTVWHEGAVDIVPKGTTKSSGIDFICERYDINPEETMGFGDGENDISMLRKCGIGIAMGNATDEVKEIADYITDSIDDDGLYKALKKYNII